MEMEAESMGRGIWWKVPGLSSGFAGEDWNRIPRRREQVNAIFQNLTGEVKSQPGFRSRPTICLVANMLLYEPLILTGSSRPRRQWGSGRSGSFLRFRRVCAHPRLGSFALLAMDAF